MENIKHKHKEGVQLFVNKELNLEVRAVEINGEGWLVGKDVAEALGYKNTRDALFKHIIEFVSGDNFYLKKNEATSYQMDSNTLKNYLKEWQQKLSGFFTENQLMVLNKLNKRELFVCNTKFGKWCVLISPQEANCIINKYIK